MTLFLISLSITAFAEIGDKTQLLAFILASHFKRPAIIFTGIAIATSINHGLAIALGTWITLIVSQETIHLVLGIFFIGISGWMVLSAKPTNCDLYPLLYKRHGLFCTTIITFFIAEIGDKTQITTGALAMAYQQPIAIFTGSTLGVLLMDAPAVFLGTFMANNLSSRLIKGLLLWSLGIMSILLFVY